MNEMEQYKERLKKLDFEFLDEKLAKAKNQNEKSFEISVQHFDSSVEAREIMQEWEFQQKKPVWITFGSLTITVRL